MWELNPLKIHSVLGHLAELTSRMAEPLPLPGAVLLLVAKVGYLCKRFTVKSPDYSWILKTLISDYTTASSVTWWLELVYPPFQFNHYVSQGLSLQRVWIYHPLRLTILSVGGVH